MTETPAVFHFGRIQGFRSRRVGLVPPWGAASGIKSETSGITQMGEAISFYILYFYQRVVIENIYDTY